MKRSMYAFRMRKEESKDTRFCPVCGKPYGFVRFRISSNGQSSCAECYPQRKVSEVPVKLYTEVNEPVSLLEN